MTLTAMHPAVYGWDDPSWVKKRSRFLLSGQNRITPIQTRKTIEEIAAPLVFGAELKKHSIGAAMCNDTRSRNPLLRRIVLCLLTIILAAMQDNSLAAQEKIDLKDASSKADALWKQGKSEEAVAEYQRLLQIAERDLGKNSTWVIQFERELASIHKASGHYAKAETYYRLALDRNESKWGKDHPNTAKAIHELAVLYTDMSQYAKAEQLLLKALAIQESKLERDHLDTIRTVNALANLYADLGLYAKAEPLYNRVLGAIETKFGKDHASTAAVVDNLAILYREMGQYEKAEPLAKRALFIRIAKLEADHPDIAKSIYSLAVLYTVTKKYELAEPLYMRALAIEESRHGKDHITTASTLAGLANLYQQMRRYENAEPLLVRALVIQESRLGKDHPGYARNLNNLANVYKNMGRYAKAEPLYASAIEILRARFGNDHPNTSTATTAYAFLFAAQGRAGETIRAFDRVFHSLRRHSFEVLPALSDGEQMKFMDATFSRTLRTGIAFSTTGGLGDENRLRAASWLLNGKNITGESLGEKLILARDADSEESRKALVELEAARRQLAAFTNKNDKSLDPKEADKLRERERLLSASLNAFDGRTRRQDPWFEMDELRQRLPEKAAFIDIARFWSLDFKTSDSGPERYAAFLSFRAGDTQIVDLGEASRIDDAIKAVRKELDAAGKTITAKGEPAAEAALREPLTALAKLVLEPLKKHIHDKDQWIISPDSNLWLVPWGILPLDDKTYAVEKHRIHYVVSGRDLLMNPLKLDRKTSAPMVMADPDFDLGLTAAPVKQSDQNRSLSKDFRLGAVRRLPGTAVEAEAIAPLLAKFGGQPQVFTDKQASTMSFRSAKSPKVVVLSTHGFFLEDETKSGKEGGPVGENPLLRCGLLLAGCNNAAKAKPGQDNGVLTGLEIVGTDLRGTEMVVLSACETGLGEVHNGEGVAGLRQAFQLAGAESVVATLWQVPDVQSAQLMVGFFDNLAQGKQRDEALRNAQLDQIQKRRAKHNAAHPFFWAAYTVTGQMK